MILLYAKLVCIIFYGYDLYFLKDKLGNLGLSLIVVATSVQNGLQQQQQQPLSNLPLKALA
jgi:hypothetical protein